MIGKAVVIEASDSSDSNDGYPSDDSGLVDIGYVMHENDDIDLNTLLGDDWLGGFSCTKKQGHTACEAQTEDANEPQEPANEVEEPTNGHQQGASGHEKGANMPQSGNGNLGMAWKGFFFVVNLS